MGLEDMEDEIHLCPHWLGEPTIHPQFDQFVEYAFAINQDRRLFHEFKLHTNAVVFNEHRARLGAAAAAVMLGGTLVLSWLAEVCPPGVHRTSIASVAFSWVAMRREFCGTEREVRVQL